MGVQRFRRMAGLLVAVAPLVALIPLGRMAVDWVAVHRVTGTWPTAAPHSYAWIVWEDADDGIRATYVFPRGPAAEAGLREGDVFYMLEGLQYFSAEDLKSATQRIEPGQVRTYYVIRDGRVITAPVRFTPYPTFLYPLSSALWHFSIWGFTLGTFLHVLGLFIAGPLALRSRAAWPPLMLILVSFLWMFGNLLRILLVTLLGPPGATGFYAGLFEALTFASLAGWIAFPVLLLRKVLRDARLDEPDPARRRRFAPGRLPMYATPGLLGLAAVLTTWHGPLGPLTLDGLLVPILFYASCYIATAALLVLGLYALDRPRAEALLWSWGRTGSALILGAALITALSVLGVVPILGAVTDTTAGWLIVCAQLLYLAPVMLVSAAPLRHGKVDEVLTRALTYLTVLGLLFFAFVGGMTLIDPYLARVQAPRYVVAGLYLILLLVVFERLARLIRTYARHVFATDRQRAHRQVSRFQEQMRSILNLDTLVRQAVEVVGRAYDARSAILFIRPPGTTGPWVSSAYHPEPPYLTERLFHRIWPHFEREGRIWARNPELNESTLPPEPARLLVERGAALVVPIQGDGAPMGLLILGTKKKRRAVYNLEDLEQLRSLGGQLALAVERLNLVEREKTLARQRAEAQLVALRAQINPHFLFNALNTIVSLIEERPEEAEAVVENLAAIFRHILQTSGHPFIPLEAELDLVGHYLAIEKARFGDKLRIETEVEAETLATPVPAFAVQTLVENAVKHGLEKQREGGRLRITARRLDDGHTEIVVADTGVGIPALFDTGRGALSPDGIYGLGLTNVAQRLEQLYQRSDLLQIESRPGEGTTACLLIPAPAGAPRSSTGDGLGTTEHPPRPETNTP
ncbi:MAG: hypothetical protein KatS3mg043_1448 [Rhodothermaceae bacterium]|nr:MAG: hypothetical protein KatS3mg043_1448 [Rhodothermaceae bacterium]